MSDKKVSYPWKAYLFGFIMTTSGIIFGFCIGQFNTFFEYLMKGKYPTYHASQYDSIKSILNTVFNGGGFLCTLTSTVFVNNFGRRTLFLGFGTMMIVFSFIQIYMPLIGLYIVRAILGYISCFYTLLGPMIVVETLPKSYIGTINSTFYMFVAIGIQIAVFMKGQFAQDYYYIVYSIPIFLEIIRMGLFLIFFNLETPRYIYIDNFKKHQVEKENEDSNTNDNERNLLNESIQQDEMIKKFSDDSRTKKFLKVFYDESAHDTTLVELNSEYFKQSNTSSSSESVLKVAFSKEYIKQTIIGFLLNYNNQLCGINVIIFYSTNLFTKLGFSNPELISSIVTAFNVLGGFLNIFTSDRLGRKTLISVGMVMISISYILNMVGDCYDISILVPIGDCMFIFFFAMSLGGILYVYQVEILPGEVIPMVSNSQWIFTLLISYFCLPLIETIGIYSLYMIFMMSTFLSWCVFIGLAVESKGKTLSELKDEFMKKKFLA